MWKSLLVPGPYSLVHNEEESNPIKVWKGPAMLNAEASCDRSAAKGQHSLHASGRLSLRRKTEERERLGNMHATQSTESKTRAQVFPGSVKHECPAHRRGASSCTALSRSGDCGLVPWKVRPWGFCVSLLFLPCSCWGVELAWGEPCAFLFLISSGCKPEHLALGSMQEQCLL